jgi:hypothetical protein
MKSNQIVVQTAKAEPPIISRRCSAAKCSEQWLFFSQSGFWLKNFCRAPAGEMGAPHSDIKYIYRPGQPGNMVVWLLRYISSCVHFSSFSKISKREAGLGDNALFQKYFLAS